MPTIRVFLDGDGAWPDLLGPDGAIDVIHLHDKLWGLAALPQGMMSGAPSLALRLDLPDGRVVIAETSLVAWIAATAALKGRFPEMFAGTPLAGPVYSTKDRPIGGSR